MQLTRRPLGSLLLVLLLCQSAHAQNLFPEDTSFETGTQNFRYYRSDSPITTVRGDAAKGCAALLVDGGISWAHGRWGNFLEKDQPYTVSFYARKLAGSGTLHFAMIGVNDWQQTGRTTFQLTDEWQRYSTSLRTNRAGTVVYPAFIPADGNTVALIDAIQLERGQSASAYQHSEALSLYAEPNGAGSVIFTPEVPELNIRLFNASVPNEAQPLQVKVSIEGSAWQETQSVSLALESTETVIIEIPEAAATGYYPASIAVYTRSGELLKQSDAPFVVTNPPAPLSQSDFFGIQDSALPRSILRRIGVSHIRTGFTVWKQMEPQEGVFAPYSLHPPEGYLWHPTAQKEFVPGSIPQWALSANGLTADLEKARVFLEHYMAELEGKTTVLDFMNEPDLELRNLPDSGIDYYVSLLEVAAPITRKHGIRLMADMSGNRSEFRERLFANGADHFDIFGVHPYSSPRIITLDGRYVASPESGAFYENIRSSAALSQKHGKALVIGELGYSLEETTGFNSPQAHRQAAYLTRMALISRSFANCESFIWFTGLDRWESGPYLYGIWRTQNGIRPLPAVAAYAQVAHEVNEATDIRFLMDTDIKVLRYTNAGGTHYAVWNTDDNADPISLAALPSTARLRSLYGAPLQPEQAQISGHPLYLSEDDSQGIGTALIAVIEARPALTVRAYLSDLGTLRLAVSNRSTRDWSGYIESGSAFRSNELTALRQSVQTVTIPLRDKPAGSYTLDFISNDGKRFSQGIHLPTPVAVPYLSVDDIATFDFKKEIASGKGIIQNSRVDVFPPDPSIAWGGSEDLSHRTLLGWDEHYFYIFSEVTDDTHLNPYNGKDTWRGDSLQVGIDARNDADGKSAYDADDSEFTFALGNPPWCHQAPPTRPAQTAVHDILQDIQRDDASKTTTYRIAIPLDQLTPLRLNAGTVFGLALCFNDTDPNEGARYYMAYGHGIADKKSPADFIKMYLSKPE